VDRSELKRRQHNLAVGAVVVVLGVAWISVFAFLMTEKSPWFALGNVALLVYVVGRPLLAYLTKGEWWDHPQWPEIERWIK
jgi:hypothetical protein